MKFRICLLSGVTPLLEKLFQVRFHKSNLLLIQLKSGP